MRGKGGGCGVSANEYSCAHGAQINFGDLTPYLNYVEKDLALHPKWDATMFESPTVPCVASSPTSDRWHHSTTPGSSLHYSQATTIKMAGYDKYRLK